MMTRRRQAEIQEEKEDELDGQVPDFPISDNVPCPGSASGSLGNNARAEFLLAKLEEEQLKQELELENRQKMLKASHKVRVARLKMKITEGISCPDSDVDKTEVINSYMKAPIDVPR